MTPLRRRLRGGLELLIAMLYCLSTSALAQPQLWTTVRAKMTGDTGYSMRYDYEGPEGAYKFNYVVQGDGSKILTEVLEGSKRGAGSRILYDPATDKENVNVKSSLVTLRRSLQSKDIQGSYLYQPLFRQLVDELVEPQPREILKAGSNSILVFGDKAKAQDRLEVDALGNPVAMRHLEKGAEVRRMTFHNLSWGSTAINWP